MAKRNTPNSAVERYLDPINDALGCITAGRVAVPARKRYQLNQVYSALLSREKPSPLACMPRLHLVVGQQFRITRDELFDEGPFKVSTVEYWYRFETPDEDELTSFHWTPEGSELNETTRLHLHIGSLLVHGVPHLPANVHKLHVPTERLSIEAVVRFAIEELGCTPFRTDWNDILETGEAPFDERRRKNSR